MIASMRCKHCLPSGRYLLSSLDQPINRSTLTFWPLAAQCHHPVYKLQPDPQALDFAHTTRPTKVQPGPQALNFSHTTRPTKVQPGPQALNFAHTTRPTKVQPGPQALCFANTITNCNQLHRHFANRITNYNQIHRHFTLLTQPGLQTTTRSTGTLVC